MYRQHRIWVCVWRKRRLCKTWRGRDGTPSPAWRCLSDRCYFHSDSGGLAVRAAVELRNSARITELVGGKCPVVGNKGKQLTVKAQNNQLGPVPAKEKPLGPNEP